MIQEGAPELSQKVRVHLGRSHQTSDDCRRDSQPDHRTAPPDNVRFEAWASATADQGGRGTSMF